MEENALIPGLMKQSQKIFVDCGCLLISGCPDHEIITQKLDYLQYCLASSLTYFWYFYNLN